MLVQEGTSGVQAAYGVLRHLSPSAAQTVARLRLQAFCTFSCCAKEVHVPSLETCEVHLSLSKCLRCQHRADGMCFIDWLRGYREDLDTPPPYVLRTMVVRAAAVERLAPPACRVSKITERISEY